MDGTPTIDPPALDARLLSLSPDLLGAVGSDGLLTLVNPAWTALLGHSEADLLGKPFLGLVHPEDRAAAAALLASPPAAGPECRLVSSTGTERHVRWTAESGPDGVLLAGRDVTDLHRVGAELQDFAYIASHDLAEPLRMVTAYLDLLQRRYGGELDETADEFIGYAVDGAQRIKAMIDALLAYSRVGTHEIQRVRFELRDLLTGQAAEGVDVAEPLAAVSGDPAQVGQLLHHLIDNAVKFRASDRPCQVTVSAVEEDGGVRIDVADNGIGIPVQQQDRVFRMFARLHGRDEYEGAGVGLSLCRRIAERHGGRISLVSEPGTGSVFSVWLPR